MGLFGKSKKQVPAPGGTSNRSPESDYHPETGELFSDIFYRNLMEDIELGYPWLGLDYHPSLATLRRYTYALSLYSWRRQEEMFGLMLKQISITYKANEPGPDAPSDESLGDLVFRNAANVAAYVEEFTDAGMDDYADYLRAFWKPALDIIKAGPRFESVMLEAQKASRKYR